MKLSKAEVEILIEWKECRLSQARCCNDLTEFLEKLFIERIEKIEKKLRKKDET